MADWSVSQGQRIFQTGGVITATTDITNSPGLTSGVKSSWFELIASTDERAGGIHLIITPATSTSYFLTDIAVGPSGSEEIVVEDWFCMGGNSANAQAGFLCYIPIEIPAGSRVSYRSMPSLNNGDHEIGMWLASRSQFEPSPYALCKNYSLPYDTGLSADPGATAHTKSAWTEVVTSLPVSTSMGFLNMGYPAASHSNGYFLVDIAVGAAGSEEIIVKDWFAPQETTEAPVPPIPITTAIPSGSRISYRVQSTITDVTDRIAAAMYMGIN